MPTYTADTDGVFAKVLDTVKVMLSRCSEVQLFLTAVDEAAALTAIDQDGLDPPASAEGYTSAEHALLKNRVFLFSDPNSAFALKIDSAGSWETHGQVVIEFVRSLTTGLAKDPRTHVRLMEMTIGRTAEELLKQNWTDGAFAFMEVVLEGPFINEGDNQFNIGPEISGVIILRVYSGS